MTNHRVSSGVRQLRLAAVLFGFIPVLLLGACGSGQPSTTTTSGLKNRAFITNTYSGNLQVVDTQNDMTAYTQQTTNSAGQIIPGEPVTVAISSTVTLEA